MHIVISKNGVQIMIEFDIFDYYSSTNIANIWSKMNHSAQWIYTYLFEFWNNLNMYNPKIMFKTPGKCDTREEWLQRCKKVRNVRVTNQK